MQITIHEVYVYQTVQTGLSKVGSMVYNLISTFLHNLN